MRHGEPGTRLYKRALAEAARLLGLLNSPGKQGDMGINGLAILLDTIHKLGLTAQLHADDAGEIVRGLVRESIVRDPEKWPTYCVRPSNYINSPTSTYYRDNADIVETELDYLIETRPSGGVWGIEWTWFDNNDKYPKELAVSTNWWRAIHGIDKMKYLRNFGRIAL